MKLAVCSVGRRVELLEWMKEIMSPEIEIVAVDMDITAPALYVTKEFMLEKEMENYDYILSLNDMEIYNLSDAIMWVTEGGRLLHPHNSLIMKCKDKSAMEDLGIRTPHTTIIKDRYGSASGGVEKIAQQYVEGEEYNVQAYYDIHNNKLIDCFIHRKLIMRAGETDRSVSCWHEDIFTQIKKLSGKGFVGPTDVDVVVQNDLAYIIDINPRFGGGYNAAHRLGVDFISLLKNNILGNELEQKEMRSYQENRVVAKYPASKIL